MYDIPIEHINSFEQLMKLVEKSKVQDLENFSPPTDEVFNFQYKYEEVVEDGKKKVCFLVASHLENFGYTLLHHAIEKNASVETLEILLKRGTKITAGRLGQTPLHFAAEKKTTKSADFLIKHCENIHVPDEYGFTPLHIAAQRGCYEWAQKLISAGATNIKSISGYTPLHCAAHVGHITLVELLLTIETNIDIPAEENLTPLLIASYGGHAEIVKLLLEKNADPNKISSFLYALGKGSIDSERGITRNVWRFSGNSALHLAVIGQFSKQEVPRDHLECVKQLCKYSVNTEIRNDQGYKAVELLTLPLFQQHHGNVKMLKFFDTKKTEDMVLDLSLNTVKKKKKTTPTKKTTPIKRNAQSPKKSLKQKHRDLETTKIQEDMDSIIERLQENRSANQVNMNVQHTLYEDIQTETNQLQLLFVEKKLPLQLLKQQLEKFLNAEQIVHDIKLLQKCGILKLFFTVAEKTKSKDTKENFSEIDKESFCKAIKEGDCNTVDNFLSKNIFYRLNEPVEGKYTSLDLALAYLAFGTSNLQVVISLLLAGACVTQRYNCGEKFFAEVKQVAPVMRNTTHFVLPSIPVAESHMSNNNSLQQLTIQ